MIKKVITGIKKLKKVFIPKSEFIEETPQKVEKTQPSYIGVAAPVVAPFDSWFSKPVKTEKAVAYEKHIAATVEYKKSVEAEQPKKEPEDIHQKMYELATKNWTTVAETQGGSENFHEGPGGWNSGNGMRQFHQ